jgi:AcrR family transcriptional regulator
MGHLFVVCNSVLPQMFAMVYKRLIYNVKQDLTMITRGLSPTKLSSFDELLNAGAAAVAARGVDNVTVADVIKISGHSRPTFYSYFGDMNGLFAEIWIRFGRPRFNVEVNDIFNWASRTEPAEGVDSALLQILCVSHRIPELQEIVVPDMREWWNAQTAGNTYIELRTAWVLAIQIGIGISMHIDPGNAQAGLVLPILAEMPDNLDGSPMLAGLGQAPDFPEADAVFGSADSLEESIMKATMEVIANSGVGAASVARIARRCRVSTGTIYPRFSTGQELVQKSFDAAIRDVVQGNLDQANEVGFGFDQYGLTIVAGLGTNRRVWRDYRLEMHVAALHDENLRATMQPGFEVTRQMLVESITSVPQLGERLAQPLSYLMQVMALGLSILHNAGLPLKELDHRVVVRYIGATLAQTS